MMQWDYKLAMSAGLDAGNRSMIKARRVVWNEDDWNVAATTFARIMGNNEHVPQTSDPNWGKGGSPKA